MEISYYDILTPDKIIPRCCNKWDDKLNKKYQLEKHISVPQYTAHTAAGNDV